MIKKIYQRFIFVILNFSKQTKEKILQDTLNNFCSATNTSGGNGYTNNCTRIIKQN